MHASIGGNLYALADILHKLINIFTEYGQGN